MSTQRTGGVPDGGHRGNRRRPGAVGAPRGRVRRPDRPSPLAERTPPAASSRTTPADVDAPDEQRLGATLPVPVLGPDPRRPRPRSPLLGWAAPHLVVSTGSPRRSTPSAASFVSAAAQGRRVPLVFTAIVVEHRQPARRSPTRPVSPARPSCGSPSPRPSRSSIGIALGLHDQPGLQHHASTGAAEAPGTTGSWIDFLTGHRARQLPRPRRETNVAERCPLSDVAQLQRPPDRRPRHRRSASPR